MKAQMDREVGRLEKDIQYFRDKVFFISHYINEFIF